MFAVLAAIVIDRSFETVCRSIFKGPAIQKYLDCWKLDDRKDRVPRILGKKLPIKAAEHHFRIIYVYSV